MIIRLLPDNNEKPNGSLMTTKDKPNAISILFIPNLKSGNKQEISDSTIDKSTHDLVEIILNDLEAYND